ncbi:ISL3 family transposase [Nocardia sp. NPDC051570]|uniref:ISL3 family transposase n=1 Tax=Nocardia sp. NPDC051570 TaxID=3364324 RepID=UPI00378C5739
MRSGGIRLRASTCSEAVRCPRCSTPSRRVHSRYDRTVAERAITGRELSIRLRVRRFRCIESRCEQKIFAEQVPDLAERYQRRTNPLTTLLGRIGLALGGRAGARMTGHVATRSSRSTLLRLVRKLPVPEPGVLPVIGVDDFATRKGHVYGTVIIDMASHRPVDVLEDREVATFAAWLEQHPEVEVICRDRGGAYAEAARQSATGAIQVADRWHLLHNLTKAVDYAIRPHRRCLADPVEQPVDQRNPLPPTQTTHAPQGLREENTRTRHREVHALVEQGVSIRAISTKLNLDRKTVRRYACAQTADALLTVDTGRRKKLDDHVPYLLQRWEQGCTNAETLYTELTGRGYKGSARSVRRLLETWRAATSPQAAIAAAVRPPKPRDIAATMMRPIAKRSDDENAQLQRIVDRCDTLKQIDRLVSDFAGMARERHGRHLDTWIATAADSGIAQLEAFADGLTKDYDAVRNGLSMDWSSGPVEGNVNRIKMIKRMMYGRANFDLLRRRILLAD